MNTEIAKINAVVEVLKGEKTKTVIADEYGFSLRSLGRYVEKFEAEAKEIINSENNSSLKFDEGVEEIIEDIPETSETAMAFIIQQATVAPVAITVAKKIKSVVNRATKDGKPSIKATVIAIMQKYKDENKTSKEFRNDAVQEIQDETGLDIKQASKYYAGYKKIVFG